MHAVIIFVQSNLHMSTPQKHFKLQVLITKLNTLAYYCFNRSCLSGISRYTTFLYLEFEHPCGNDSEVILSIKDVDEEIELVLSFTSTCMCTESTQPPAHVEVLGLLTNFLLWMCWPLTHLLHWPLTHPLHCTRPHALETQSANGCRD